MQRLRGTGLATSMAPLGVVLCSNPDADHYLIDTLGPQLLISDCAYSKLSGDQIYASVFNISSAFKFQNPDLKPDKCFAVVI